MLTILFVVSVDLRLVRLLVSSIPLEPLVGHGCLHVHFAWWHAVRILFLLPCLFLLGFFRVLLLISSLFLVFSVVPLSAAVAGWEWYELRCDISTILQVHFVTGNLLVSPRFLCEPRRFQNCPKHSFPLFRMYWKQHPTISRSILILSDNTAGRAGEPRDDSRAPRSAHLTSALFPLL